MNKIYVITDGDYSDYHIVAVYDDKNLAEKVSKKIGADVEEYNLNPFSREDVDKKNIYFVRMDRDGNVPEIKIDNTGYRLENLNEAGFCMQGNMYMTVLANDEKHAIKIVNEKRVQIIAENKWKGK